MKTEKISSQKAKVMKSLYKKMISDYDSTIRASQDLGLSFLKAKSSMSKKAFNEWTALNFPYMDSKEISFCLKTYQYKLDGSKTYSHVSSLVKDIEKTYKIDFLKGIIRSAEKMIKELQ